MLSAILISLVAGITAPALPEGLLEAESFERLGGWIVDTQSMDVMGSPYALAHGMGKPVEDAVTSVTLAGTGPHRFWVRTRDWTAPSSGTEPPGRFQVLVNGQPLSTTFGTEGADWHWQDGGVLDLSSPDITVTLHDLTGFEGRCDAILISSAVEVPPPNEEHGLQELRHLVATRHATETKKYDFVVAGGGMAGTCAAITAARLGLHTALLQDRPVLGGNNSSEVRVHLNGEINLPPYPALGNVVKELDSGKKGNAQPAGNYGDDQKLAVVRAEKNLDLFLNMHVTRPWMHDQTIRAVTAVDTHTGLEYRFEGRVFADCTGDATLGALAKADFRMGREGRAETNESMAPPEPDTMTLGSSVQWYSVETDAVRPFPECPWALPFTPETCQPVTRGDWDWEAGSNWNQVSDIERTRDHLFRAIYGNWAFLKNHHPDKDTYSRLDLGWVAPIAGKRESRRLLGDVILQQQDVEERRAFPDACVTTTWSIDLHYPNPKNTAQFPGQEFRAVCDQRKIEPYPIPYRCLYSRNIENLFMAGRNISVTHVALGTVRVMRTGGVMGEVIGMAAAVCCRNETTPRGVYQDHLDALKQLMTTGAGR